MDTLLDLSTKEAVLEHCSTTGRTYVQMTLGQADKELGSIFLELYTDLAPSTCANFLSLVNGTGQYHYKGCPLHRVVPRGYVQGGDVVEGSGKGKGLHTIPDETFVVKHDVPGIIGMANLDQPHTASTQFYITTSPLPWLDGKRVAFGRLLTKSSLETLRGLEDLPLFKNERPIPDVLITDCQVIHVPPPS